MKANVKMIDKSKNSFIYFQLGLIATMVAVLFVLEFNFETIDKKMVYIDPSEPVSEKVYRYNPSKEIVKSEPIKNNRLKEVVKPVVLPKVINQFKETEEEVAKEIVSNSAHENFNTVPNNANESENQTENASNSSSVASKEEVFVSVEFLPKFTNCINVSKENQKECFDNALKNEINKYLIYPENDLRNGLEGTVFVQFIVDENGNFTSIKSVDNNRSTINMKKAVENAVKKLPKIIPARQGDNNVKVRYTMPITFKISK